MNTATLRAVIRRGLADRRRSALTWGISFGVYGGFIAAIYPSIHHALSQIVKHYPSALRQAFDVGSLGTVEGYVQAELFSLIVPLAIAYFAIHSLTGPTVTAEERGDLDTILSLPVSRSELLIGSALVTAAVSAVIMAIAGVMLFLTGRIAGTHISLGLVAAGVMGVWPLALVAAGFAAVAVGYLHTSRSVHAFSLGLIVAMYVLDLAGRLAHGLAPIRWISAFKYYGSPMRDGIDPPSFIGLIIAGAVLVAVGALLFERRDIRH